METEWKKIWDQATFKSIYDIAYNGPIVQEIGLARFGTFWHVLACYIVSSAFEKKDFGFCCIFHLPN